MTNDEMMNPNFSPKEQHKEPLSIKAKGLLDIKRLNKKPIWLTIASISIILSSLLYALSTRGSHEERLEEQNSSNIAIESINPATQILGWDDNTTLVTPQETNLSNPSLLLTQNDVNLTPPTLLPIPQVEEFPEYQATPQNYQSTPQVQFETMPTPKTKNFQDQKVVELKTSQTQKNKQFYDALHSPTTIKNDTQNISSTPLNASNQNSYSTSQPKESIKYQVPSSQDSDYLAHTLKSPISEYEIKKGTVIPSVLVGSINSELPSDVIAQVSESVYDSKSGKHLLIPQGSKVVGVYSSSVSYGQSRLMIVWSRINFPNGKTLNLDNMNGVDQAGHGGFNDITNSHYLKIFGSAFLISLITGEFSISNKDVTVNSSNGGYNNRVSQTGEKMLEKNMAISPTLEIRSGYRFNVFVNKDMILEPL